MDTYLVAYDIANPKRLRKMAKTCEDFGLRRQFSSLSHRYRAGDGRRALFSPPGPSIHQPDAPARDAGLGRRLMQSRSPRWRVGLVWVSATPCPGVDATVTNFRCFFVDYRLWIWYD